jgi:hypothetical protein
MILAGLVVAALVVLIGHIGYGEFPISPLDVLRATI